MQIPAGTEGPTTFEECPCSTPCFCRSGQRFYQECHKQFEVKSALDKEVKQVSDFIARDLPRTQDLTEKHYPAAGRILGAAALCFPHIGYCQGMNVWSLIVLRHFGFTHEWQSFWMLQWFLCSGLFDFQKHATQLVDDPSLMYDRGEKAKPIEWSRLLGRTEAQVKAKAWQDITTRWAEVHEQERGKLLLKLGAGAKAGEEAGKEAKREGEKEEEAGPVPLQEDCTVCLGNETTRQQGKLRLGVHNGILTVSVSSGIAGSERTIQDTMFDLITLLVRRICDKKAESAEEDNKNEQSSSEMWGFELWTRAGNKWADTSKTAKPTVDASDTMAAKKTPAVGNHGKDACRFGWGRAPGLSAGWMSSA
eukprot:g67302.t1